MTDIIKASIDEIDTVVKKVLTIFGKSGIILLQGDLASGKTTFVKSFVKYLGIDEEVSSPTFSIMNIYADKVYHYDIYNDGTNKFIESGLLENLEENGFHIIEWADEKLENMLKEYGFNYIKIEIKPEGEKRVYKCTY